MKNIKISKKHKMAIICSAVTVLVLGTASFMAYFISDKTAKTDIPTGVINVELEESFKGDNGDLEEGTNPDGDGLTNATKVIKGNNTGTQPAYVRVKIFPVVQSKNMDDEWETFGGISTTYIKYTMSNAGWVDGGDGYYYYNKILNPTESTSEIKITNLHLDMPNEIANMYADLTLRVDMLVQLESTQSSNELWKLNWGIDSLPSEVEQ